MQQLCIEKTVNFVEFTVRTRTALRNIKYIVHRLGLCAKKLISIVCWLIVRIKLNGMMMHLLLQGGSIHIVYGMYLYLKLLRRGFGWCFIFRFGRNLDHGNAIHQLIPHLIVLQ